MEPETNYLKIGLTIDVKIKGESKNVKPIFELVEKIKKDVICSETDIKSELDKKEIKIKNYENNIKESYNYFDKYEDLKAQVTFETIKIKPIEQENRSSVSDSEIICSKIKNYRNGLENRKKVKQYKHQIYYCAHCNYHSNKRDLFVKHITIHFNQDKYKCAYCSFTSSRSSTVSKHSRTHNNIGGMYKCATCKKVFKIRHSLMRHLQRKTGERPYKCAYCNNSFTAKYILQNHLRTHTGERPYKCLHCDYTCARKCSLDVHDLRMHSNNYRYNCTLCNRRFKTLQDKKSHLETHTNHSSDSKKPPFKCSLCNYSFKHESRLIYHMRHHLGERPYKCGHCGLSFFRKTELVYHISKHMKPYQCSTCEYSSHKVIDLRKHEQNQHRQAKYNCANCKYTSDQRAKMEKHVKTHLEQ